MVVRLIRVGRDQSGVLNLGRCDDRGVLGERASSGWMFRQHLALYSNQEARRTGFWDRTWNLGLIRRPSI